MTTARKFYIFFLGFSFAGIGWLLINHYFLQAIPVCLFRSITGIPCPSCGITGTMSLLWGDHSHFLIFNPLGILLLPLVFILPVWIILDLILARESFYRIYLRYEKILRRKKIALLFISFLLLIWTINLVQFFNP